jgi:cytochrome b561
VQSQQRYGRVAIWLHWVLAAAIAGQVALGWWMQEIPKGPDGVRAWWFNIHKSIGVTLATLVLLRLAWRVRHGAPALPDSIASWQRTAAAASHAGLYTCMVVMPVSGFLGSSFSGYPVRLFGMALPQWSPAWAAGKDLMSALHLYAGWLLVALIALHIGAALLHELRGERILRRMWV